MAYVKTLAEVIGHADRAEPLRDYCRGLLLPGERKSVEPIAAVTAPARVSAKHQSLLHFVANAPWSNERVLSRIQGLTLPVIEGSGAIEAWIIDDTGFPKKGHHSVGVARQYCGQLGKRDNCQVAVSLSLANHTASLPIAWRLYLPLEGTADTERRAAADAERRLETIMDSASDAIVAWALDGTITDWNPAAERLYGYTAAEAIGNDTSIFDFIHGVLTGDAAAYMQDSRAVVSSNLSLAANTDARPRRRNASVVRSRLRPARRCRARSGNARPTLYVASAEPMMPVSAMTQPRQGPNARTAKSMRPSQRREIVINAGACSKLATRPAAKSRSEATSTRRWMGLPDCTGWPTALLVME